MADSTRSGAVLKGIGSSRGHEVSCPLQAAFLGFCEGFIRKAVWTLHEAGIHFSWLVLSAQFGIAMKTYNEPLLWSAYRTAS